MENITTKTWIDGVFDLCADGATVKSIPIQLVLNENGKLTTSETLLIEFTERIENVSMAICRVTETLSFAPKPITLYLNLTNTYTFNKGDKFKIDISKYQ